MSEVPLYRGTTLIKKTHPPRPKVVGLGRRARPQAHEASLRSNERLCLKIRFNLQY